MVRVGGLGWVWRVRPYKRCCSGVEVGHSRFMQCLSYSRYSQNHLQWFEAIHRHVRTNGVLPFSFDYADFAGTAWQHDSRICCTPGRMFLILPPRPLL